ncbi:MAG: hypothetical protein ACMUIU_02500 [bacterium]
MAKNVIFDSGFWYALYDERDNYHNDAILFEEYLKIYNLIIPWPILYETLNTRFVRRNNWLSSFENYIKSPNVLILSDESYRERALNLVFDLKRGVNSYSLVDLVIREILKDTTIKIDALVTFNPKDFIDICMLRNLEIFNG